MCFVLISRTLSSTEDPKGLDLILQKKAKELSPLSRAERMKMERENRRKIHGQSSGKLRGRALFCFSVVSFKPESRQAE